VFAVDNLHAPGEVELPGYLAVLGDFDEEVGQTAQVGYEGLGHGRVVGHDRRPHDAHYGAAFKGHAGGVACPDGNGTGCRDGFPDARPSDDEGLLVGADALLDDIAVVVAVKADDVTGEDGAGA